MIAATLPLPPSANHLFANVPGQGRIKSREYRAWTVEAGYVLNLAAVAKRINGPFRVRLQAGSPNRLRDRDNVVKPVLDLLQAHGAIRNDRDCQKIEAEWVEGVTGVYVSIHETVAVPLMDGKKPPEPKPYRKSSEAHRSARKLKQASAAVSPRPSLSQRETRR